MKRLQVLASRSRQELPADIESLPPRTRRHVGVLERAGVVVSWIDHALAENKSSMLTTEEQVTVAAGPVPNTVDELRADHVDFSQITVRQIIGNVAFFSLDFAAQQRWDAMGRYWRGEMTQYPELPVMVDAGPLQ